MCGECIGVDGACLTVIERGENWFHVETMPENLRYTRLGCLEPGAHVNLECALSTDGPMSGHFVQGHVEATVAVLSVKEDGMKRYCEVECPACLRSSIIPNGLVALDALSFADQSPMVQSPNRTLAALESVLCRMRSEDEDQTMTVPAKANIIKRIYH